MRAFLAFCASLLVAAPSFATNDELYNALGGMAVIEKVVGRTIDLSLADERIAKTFDNTNTKRIKNLIAQQICQLTGGPCNYTGRTMRQSHAHLKLTNFHFNALVENLQTAMDESDIPFRTQNELLAILAPMQRETTAPGAESPKQPQKTATE